MLPFPRNREQLARSYPRGVRYTRAGYPIFSRYAVKRVHVDDLNGQMKHDNRLANRKAKIPGDEPPDGYTWHPVEDGRTMELVPEQLHKAAKHTGGRPAIVNHRAGREPGLDSVTPGGAFTWPERGIGGLGTAAGGPGGVR